MVEPTALVFVGGHCDTARVPQEMLSADLIIAADSGQITAAKCGVIPHLIVGDFDSSDLPSQTDAEIIRVPAEKDDTDTMLACNLAIQRGARRITILGGTGGRIDHSLSNPSFQLSFSSSIPSHSSNVSYPNFSNGHSLLIRNAHVQPSSYMLAPSCVSASQTCLAIFVCIG